MRIASGPKVLWFRARTVDEEYFASDKGAEVITIIVAHRTLDTKSVGDTTDERRSIVPKILFDSWQVVFRYLKRETDRERERYACT